MIRSVLLTGTVAALLAGMGASAEAATSCDKRIAFVRDVLDRDIKTGFVGQGIYDEMSADLGRAEAACSAGNDGEAQTIVSATQRKHGYPVR